MALEFKKGVFTAPTVNGTDTVISGLTDPKAIILWTTKQTAAGGANTHANFGIGVATYNASAVQQWYTNFTSEDVVTASNVSRDFNDTACLKTHTQGTITVESECDLVSMDSTSITLDWVDAPPTAILVHYIVLGGSDVTAARAGTFAGSLSSPQAVTVVTGFGKPDLLVFASQSATALGGSAGAARTQLGFAKSTTERKAMGWWETDAAASMATSVVQVARAIFTQDSITGYGGEAELDSVANYPTDGFQLTWPNLLSAAHMIGYLAIKGTFQSAIGSGAAPITGTPPVVQDNAAGFAPLGGIFFSDNIASHSTVDATNADVTGITFGATDGTNEGLSVHTQEDGAATSMTGVVHSETKSLAMYIAAAAAAPTLQSEADGSFSGDNLRLSWNDIDSVARAYSWVALGSAAGAAEQIPTLVTAPYRRT